MLTRSIQFWDVVNDRLVEAAEARNVSVNWLVNKLCEEGLDNLRSEIKLTEGYNPR